MNLILLICILIIAVVTMVSSLIATIVIVKKNKEKELVIKTLKICGIVALVVLIIGLAFAVSNMGDAKDNKTTTTTQSASSTELEEAGFNKLSLDEYLKLVKSSDKSIILVARPTCYYCQQFTPILKQASEELNLTVNYINTDDFSSDDWTKFQNSLDYLSSEEWGTPLTMIVQDGELVDKNNGYVELNGIKEFFTKNGFGK